MLLGPRRALLRSASSAAVAVTYRNQTFDTTDAIEYTFAGFDIASSTDDLIIGVCCRNTGSITCTGITVNGVAATKRIQQGEGSAPNQNHAQLWTCPSQGDSTPDIVVTWSGTALRCMLAVWTITGHASLVPTDTDSSTSDPGSVTLTVPAKGAAVGLAADHSASTHTWTGITEDYDQSAGEGSFASSGAHVNSAAGGDIAMQADYSAATVLPKTVFAAWGP